MGSLRYIFGPVLSRRLGRSLGVDVIPRKTCTLDCVYCELGLTDKRALRRMEYVPASDVIGEIRAALSRPDRIDMITFSGSGEPTLNSSLGTMIRSIKGFTRIPIAVLTNGTLLSLPEVRKDLMEADVVLPSLDAATVENFEKVNRPHPKLQLGRILEGMRIFRREYSGQIWLEILLIRGINDGDEEISLLKQIIDEINPDKVQLNTVVRPPAVEGILPVRRADLEKICSFLGPKCEIIDFAEHDESLPPGQADTDRVLALLSRRAMTLAEISSSLAAPLNIVQQLLDKLGSQEMIHTFEFEGKHYFGTTRTPA